MSTRDILNYQAVDDRIITSGQPDETELRAAAAEGFEAVVNLAPHDLERSPVADEAGLVRTLGMEYHHIPVTWNDPHDEDFTAFCRTLDGLQGRSVLIHCFANYRVTAFFSLYALRRLAWTEAQANRFMSIVWVRGEYPVWDAFIDRLRTPRPGGGPCKYIQGREDG